jgi:hypothetical protein
MAESGTQAQPVPMTKVQRGNRCKILSAKGTGEMGNFV